MKINNGHKLIFATIFAIIIILSLWQGLANRDVPKTDVSFQYPEKLSTEYIHTVEWPPQVQVLPEAVTCFEAGSEIALGGQTVKRVIGGKEYCVTKESEGAAGSVYTKYIYAFETDARPFSLMFTLRFVQCANFDDPQKTACGKERLEFNPDTLADQMARSVK